MRELLEPHGCRLEFRRGTVALEKPDTETFMAFYEENFGPVVMAKGALGDIWPKLRGELVAMLEQWNRATDGSLHIDAEYLLTVARREA
ncbi:hypothetical protein [Streptomyces boninensis]|uniref:hypothetical protein n=1 Tax=Streptomyces boninensis TaxID=2039455 RepID=UPI003B20CBA4